MKLQFGFIVWPRFSFSIPSFESSVWEGLQFTCTAALSAVHVSPFDGCYEKAFFFLAFDSQAITADR